MDILKLKMLRAAFLLVAVSVVFFPLRAKEFSLGGINYTITASNEVSVYPFLGHLSNKSKYEGDITIPSIVKYGNDTYTVTGIHKSAFEYADKLNSINMPSTIRTIGVSAFSYSALTEIKLSESLKSIGESAFSGCEKLVSLAVPTSVETVEKWAFQNCRGLRSIEFGSSLSFLGEACFRGCLNLEKISVADDNVSFSSLNGIMFSKDKTLLIKCPQLYVGSVAIPSVTEAIGEEAFRECSALTELVIPDKVITIHQYAFYDCSGLIKVIFGNSVASIGQYAFTNCAALECVVFPESLKRMDKNAFWGCKSLKSVKFGNSIKSISLKCFLGCSSLSEVKLPDDLTTIGDNAFEGTAITSITIGDKMERLGGYAFNGCGKLSKLISLNHIPPTCYELSSEESIYNDCTLYVPAGSKEAYNAANIWCKFKNIKEIESSGVEDAKVQNHDAADIVIFNLQGIRVYKPKPGVIYIINGRKMMLK